MKKKLSSDLTPFYMYSWLVYPLILGIVLVLTDIPTEGKVIYSVFFVLGALLIWAWNSDLKTVETDATFLYVSDGRFEAIVPHLMIKSVRQSWWGREPVIIVKFKVATRFGDQIEFLPYHYFRWPFSQHPVVNELKSLACLPLH